MPELIWIIDPATGDLVVEGLGREDALALAGDLLPSPRLLNCAQPLATVPLPTNREADRHGPVLRVAALWHGSVVEGPGRRSVLQVQGCPLRCSPLIYSTRSRSRRPSDGHTCWGLNSSG
jgi:hypothetical protein